ncbi:thiamine pyrophosphate-binding protein [Streptosporangium canum]|uniref:thiamine pyrophosphate-binding protein n=1 Tax=Streptosporangium canum TaxID=324952 RepID=UPI00378C6DA0
MTDIAPEVLIERLAAWGVDTVFGLPGDGINGIMEGLRRHADRVRFVLVHHEEAAAFMATAHAKATGRIGVCLATSGPGGIHLLNGLYDAKLDHQPVLAITGMQETSVLGTGYQQEVHLDRLYADVADYNPAQLPGVVDIAILTCDSGTIATWAARHWTIRGERRFYLSGNLATMAPGLPYAIAIQHAFPGRQVIAFVGDGGFAMLMAEFLTAAQHRLPIKVVINNNALGPRSATTRRSSSPSPSSRGSRTRRRSPPPCSKTRSPSLDGDRDEPQRLPARPGHRPPGPAVHPAARPGA